jgi:hypothetical protein
VVAGDDTPQRRIPWNLRSPTGFRLKNNRFGRFHALS